MKNTLYRFFLICFTVMSLCLLDIGNVDAISLPSTYATFNCNNNSTRRCYGYNQQDISGLLGAQTRLFMVPLSYNGSAFLIGDILWFADDSSPQSNNCYETGVGSPGSCWIEIGETAKFNHASLGTYVYWADVRPRSASCFFIACGYAEHPKVRLVRFSQLLNMSISYVSPGTWQVRTTGAASFSDQSVNNGMIPDNFQFGSELAGAGTSGVNAVMPTTTFSANQYRTGNSWHYVNALGTGSWSFGLPNNPPWAGWRVNPGSTGGVWYTCIKSSQWNGSQYPNPC